MEIQLITMITLRTENQTWKAMVQVACLALGDREHPYAGDSCVT